MKVKFVKAGNIFLVLLLLTLVFFVRSTTSIGSYRTLQANPLYDPWCDFDNDGDIDLYDAVYLLTRYGAKGTPIEKASLEYNSGWIDITDKCGQYFNITHNLNSTDVMVEIRGKTTLNGGVHQLHFGLAGYTLGWSETYGGAYNDQAQSIVQTTDEGYAIAGYTYSFGYPSIFRAWLVKTDSYGNVEWNRTYSGGSGEAIRSILQTSDGGFIMAGETWSYGASNNNFWLLKTDFAGNPQWNRTYGGIGGESAFSVVQTSDGGYALAGYTDSFGAGNGDYWLVKTDANGYHQWNKTYGTSGYEWGYSLIRTSDGGYALSGQRITGTGWYDSWLIKIDSAGNHQWNKTYGGSDYDKTSSLVQTSDGGYALGGYTGWYDTTYEDFWLVKTDASGNVQWSKTYGGMYNDAASAMIQTSEGGYALTGYTQYPSAGYTDFWLVKTDPSGNMQWNKTYGGAGPEMANSIMQTLDGAYVIAGRIGDWLEDEADLMLVKSNIESGLAWTSSTADTITLYRGATDPWWNFVRVRIWNIKENP
jgi:hypothetical protein